MASTRPKMESASPRPCARLPEHRLLPRALAWQGWGTKAGELVGEPCPHVPTPAQAQELKHTITFLLDGNPPSS